MVRSSQSLRIASQPGVRKFRRITCGLTLTVPLRFTKIQTSRLFFAQAELALFDRGDEITLFAGNEGIRFLLVSGKPIEEPVAWYGPL